RFRFSEFSILRPQVGPCRTPDWPAAPPKAQGQRPQMGPQRYPRGYLGSDTKKQRGPCGVARLRVVCRCKLGFVAWGGSSGRATPAQSAGQSLFFGTSMLAIGCRERGGRTSCQRLTHWHAYPHAIEELLSPEMGNARRRFCFQLLSRSEA